MTANANPNQPSVTPFLWFESNAQAAAAFYRAIFAHQPDPTPEEIAALPQAMSATFELNGQTIIAFNGGPHYRLSPAFSLMVQCETQQDIDYFWQRFLDSGGTPNRCGWLTDRFGLSWQIVPRMLPQLLGRGRALQAMMGMVKLDIAELERAASENPA